jgi:hypothetical protein
MQHAREAADAAMGTGPTSEHQGSTVLGRPGYLPRVADEPLAGLSCGADRPAPQRGARPSSSMTSAWVSRSTAAVLVELGWRDLARVEADDFEAKPVGFAPDVHRRPGTPWRNFTRGPIVVESTLKK